MALVYLLTCDQGCAYVGCTTRQLNRRLIEIRYQARNRDFGPSKCFRLGHSGHSMRVLESVTEDRRFEVEKTWIQRIGRGKLLNRTDGGAGPNGFSPTEEQRLLSGEGMRRRWEADRSGMLKRVNSHKTSEFQRRVGKLGAAARWKKAGDLSR